MESKKAAEERERIQEIAQTAHSNVEFPNPPTGSKRPFEEGFQEGS